MRKPNYDFERSQRDGAKRAKAEAKLQKKRDQLSDKAQPSNHNAGTEPHVDEKKTNEGDP